MISLLRTSVLCVLLSSLTFGQASKPSLSGPTNSEGQKHFDKAREWMHARNYDVAQDEFRKAYEADPQCAQCATEGIQTAVDMHDVKRTIRLADLVIASKSPQLVRYATYAKGHMLLLEGEGSKKNDELQQAHAVFGAWLAEHPDDLDMLFDDGIALSHLEKDSEAAARFAQYAKYASVSDPRRARAIRMIELPALGRARMAPAFTATDINGQQVSPDALNGRVVLIDFWATWCGPCNEELPHIKKIAQTYANQPLTVISISWDSDAEKWKQFVAKNGMTWPQLRDADHSISYRFGINAIPHYFTIDTDGVLQSEQLGGGTEIDGKLKKMVAEAVKHQQQMQSAAGH